jgi:2-methylisocitrate lyase-like PEP mutase family enzyme
MTMSFMGFNLRMLHLNSKHKVDIFCMFRMRDLVQHAYLTNTRYPVLNARQQFATKVSALSLTSLKRQGKKITMVTAYDFPSAIHVARASIDIILVGDSVAMVELGYDTTQPVTIDDMLHHASSVKRGVDFANVDKAPLLIGDMPFGTYEFEDTDIALRHAYRFVKEAGMDAIKLEVSIFSNRHPVVE